MMDEADRRALVRSIGIAATTARCPPSRTPTAPGSRVPFAFEPSPAPRGNPRRAGGCKRTASRIPPRPPAIMRHLHRPASIRTSLAILAVALCSSVPLSAQRPEIAGNWRIELAWPEPIVLLSLVEEGDSV